MKKLILISTVIIILFTLYSVSRDESLKESKRYKFAVISKVNMNDYWKEARLGAVAAGHENGIDVNYYGPKTEEDVDEQISLVQNVIDNKFDGLIISPCDYNALVPIVEEASKIMPVIIIDSEINSNKIISYIGTDNKDSGRLAGDALAKKLNGKGNVLILSFYSGAENSQNREQGVKESLANYPEINLVNVEYSPSGDPEGMNFSMDILDKYPDIDGIISLNAISSENIGNAVEAKGLQNKITLVTYDNSKDVIRLIDNDVIEATLVQDPFAMGYLGVTYAYNSLIKKIVPKKTNTNILVVDKENLFLPENQKIIFPVG